MIELLEQLETEMKRVNQCVHNVNAMKYSKVDRSVPLTAAQRQQLLRKERVPINSALQQGPKCLNYSINKQLENDGIVEHNKQVNSDYKANMEV